MRRETQLAHQGAHLSLFSVESDLMLLVLRIESRLAVGIVFWQRPHRHEYKLVLHLSPARHEVSVDRARYLCNGSRDWDTKQSNA